MTDKLAHTPTCVKDDTRRQNDLLPVHQAGSATRRRLQIEKALWDFLRTNSGPARRRFKQ